MDTSKLPKGASNGNWTGRREADAIPSVHDRLAVEGDPERGLFLGIVPLCGRVPNRRTSMNDNQFYMFAVRIVEDRDARGRPRLASCTSGWFGR